ncbi:hypothetical protein [Hyalangium minutum]|nr:hypothetical protein [Hyalangium minutum]
MKIDGRDHAEPARTTPAPGQFQQVLQRAAAPASSAFSSANPSPGKALPRLPSPPAGAKLPPSQALRPPAKPPASAAPLPGSASRLPSTALSSGPVVATSRSALASPENLGQTRQAMHGESLRLRNARTEAQTVSQEKTEHRLTELISRELAREFRAEPSTPLPSARLVPPPPESPQGPGPAEGFTSAGETRLAVSQPGLSPADAPDPQARVEATLQLIEKIEVFVQSQRPALRLSLGEPLSATVQVERTGPREVALRIQGRQGPLAQEELMRIREGLEARGLRLRSLHVE